MSGSPPTQNQASGVVNTTHRYLRREPAFADQTIHDIFKSAGLANRSPDVRQTETRLDHVFFTIYKQTLPFAPEPRLQNIDVSVKSQVGWVHHTSEVHNDCASSCSKVYLRLAYYPYVTHESQQTAVFCIDYRIQRPSGMSERACTFHLQCCDPIQGHISGSATIENLVTSVRLGETLDEFNMNLALSMAFEISRQVRDKEEYTCRTDYDDAFPNVNDEVERFLAFWEELKDDIFHHLFAEQNTYFDSRDVGLFI